MLKVQPADAPRSGRQLRAFLRRESAVVDQRIFYVNGELRGVSLVHQGARVD